MKNLEDYPYVMNAPQLAKLYGISTPTAYEIMRRTDFPTIALSDAKKSNKRVFRDDAVKWLKERQQGA